MKSHAGPVRQPKDGHGTDDEAPLQVARAVGLRQAPCEAPWEDGGDAYPHVLRGSRRGDEQVNLVLVWACWRPR